MMHWDITDRAWSVLTKGATLFVEVSITSTQPPGKSTTLAKLAKLLESEGFDVRRVDNGFAKLQAACKPSRAAFPFNRKPISGC